MSNKALHRNGDRMRVVHVDAFTSLPFAGNPAAVCLFPQAQADTWMQALASELHLPMTAFVFREGASDVFRLRWFNTAGEAQLCGHATLASAHVLWESGEARPEEPIRFLTRSGELRARRLAEGWIELDFPAEPAVAEERQDLAQELGVRPLWMGRNRLHYLLELESESAVRALQPDFRRLADVLAPVRGVIVTARGDSAGYDFVSRYFAPAMGIDEDSVTGSAHCSLGPYWASRLGKTEMLAFQASSRGGVLRVRFPAETESTTEPRVYLAGQAVTLMRSELQ